MIVEGVACRPCELECLVASKKLKEGGIRALDRGVDTESNFDESVGRTTGADEIRVGDAVSPRGFSRLAVFSDRSSS